MDISHGRTCLLTAILLSFSGFAIASEGEAQFSNEVSDSALTIQPVDGVYTSKNKIWKKVEITSDPNWDEVRISDPRARLTKDNISETAGHGPAVRIVPYSRNSKRWHNSDKVVFYHWRNGCSFEYKIEIIPEVDGFYLREFMPSGSSGYGGTNCRLDGYDWHTHKHRYYLKWNNYTNAYKAAIARETNEERKKEYQLFLDASFASVNQIENLLSSGVNPNARDFRQRTPLMVAAWQGQLESFRTLEPVSDLALTDEVGNDVYAYIEELGKRSDESAAVAREMLRLLLHGQATPAAIGKTLVWASSKPSEIDFVLELIDLGPDDESRSLALSNLVNQVHDGKPDSKAERAFVKLVNLGVDSRRQAMALGLAIYNKRPDLYETFRQAGCDPRAVNSYNQNALWFASRMGDVALVKSLLEEFGSEAGANNFASDDKYSPMTHALRRGNVEVAEALLPFTDLTKLHTVKEIPIGIYAAGMIAQEKIHNARIIDLMLAANPPLDLNAEWNGKTTLDMIIDGLFKVTGGYHTVSPSDQYFQYLKSTYLWLAITHNAPHNEKAPPDWILR